MPEPALLIANRGEVAIRIARAAAGLGLRTVAIHTADDADSLHTRRADAVRALPGRGAAGYLDIAAIIGAARAAGCTLIHPGYGFLSENPDFARACADAGLTFIGPRPDTLALFGDKLRARTLAADCGVPVPQGTSGPTDLVAVQDFFAALPPGSAAMITAVAGGGGRGMRIVSAAADIPEAFARCESEARAAFGNGALFVERLVAGARHVEVQVLADRHGAAIHLGERECSLQRRHQKLVEIAPSPAVSPALRARLTGAALGMARAAGYDGLGTFEFLVGEDGEFVFIEANPRLQVEHTVTEEVTGIDLVRAQIRVAQGAGLAALGLAESPALQGYAIQVRINGEVMAADGGVVATGGRIAAFEPAGGPGIRTDSAAYAGYSLNPAFDSLLAKLVVHSRAPDFAAAAAKAHRALRETRIDGPATNLPFLRALLAHPDVAANRVDTRFVERNLAALLGPAEEPLFFPPADAVDDEAGPAAPQGTVAVSAPMAGRIVALMAAPGDPVHPGQPVAVIEAMKSETVIAAGTGGIVRSLATDIGEVVREGAPLLFIAPADIGSAAADAAGAVDLDHIRPDLAEALAFNAATLDAARPDAVARRRATGQRTARENIDDLCDSGSFSEYGGLAIAGQRSRRTEAELRRMSPADGLIAGTATVNAACFGEARARAMVLAYDYTVFAGTQGIVGHKKTDRMLELAERLRLPVVLFAEGGGGRPGDTDYMGVTGLDSRTFQRFARLSGLVPLVGIVSGRCFAGNAALLGCCDVIIATGNASIGMAGPAMIEGGGLGVVAPDAVGPVAIQCPNGVIDILVRDEAEAVAGARRYLGYFQGPLAGWDCADQRRLRHLVPERRMRNYDMRAVIAGLADTGSVLELRAAFGSGMVTCLARIEGRAIGILANDPTHLGGAIDADAADKAARFMQLCDAHDLPILSLCDTPGFMVGPEAEKTALVRHVSRMFVTAGGIDVPFLSVVIRKGYGLGAMAMAGGCFHGPVLTAAWPTGEFGGMGIEGAVRLAYRKELAAIADPIARTARFEEMVAAMYDRGKALSIAAYLEIDAVIDPAQTRGWIAAGLRAAPVPAARSGKKRMNIDTW